ncbi:MAG: GNAT family N-acetyltransferase [Nitrospira sp.]
MFYDSKELIHVERSLDTLLPRYTRHPSFTVRELYSNDFSLPVCLIPDSSRAVFMEALAEGCRVFALYDGEIWAGCMLVGRKYSFVNREFCYPIPSDQRHIVNLAIEVEPRYRAGKAAGFLKEAVMLQLKQEGFERVLGGIETTNHGSLALARHFDFHQVRRVCVRKVFGIRWVTILEAEKHVSLQRAHPKRSVRRSHAQV